MLGKSSVAIVVSLKKEPRPMGTWLSPAPMAMPSNAVQAGGFQILRKRLGPLQPWRRSGCFRGGEARFGNGANRIPVGNRRELDEIEHSGRVQVVELLRSRSRGRHRLRVFEIEHTHCNQGDGLENKRGMTVPTTRRLSSLRKRATVAGC